MADFPHTDIWQNVTWTNYHASLQPRHVDDYVTLVFDPSGPPQMRQQGLALSSVVKHCVDSGQRLSVRGSGWSLSRVVSPDKLMLDPSALNLSFKIPDDWLTAAYRAIRDDKVPFFTGAGAKIGQINDDLGQEGLALQTSGAADGHRMAGCIATGTHGADIRVGAVHDTVKAVCLLVAPDRMILVQATEGMLTDAVAQWIQDSTGIPTSLESEDGLLHAAQVALGGLGLVYGLILEAVPLYEFVGVEAKRPLLHEDIWQLIGALDSTRLDQDVEPDVLACMLFPYAKPRDSAGAVASIYQKRARTRPYTAPTHADAMIATDTSKLVSAMSSLSRGSLGGLVGHVITTVGQAQYEEPPSFPRFPGELFGPTTLPPGHGASTEIVFAREHAAKGVIEILEILERQSRNPGRHHLGVCGVRFVAGSKAHLAMNQSDGTTFVEVAGLKTKDSKAIQKAVWDGLRDAGIPYVCHWGQEHDMRPAELRAYYGQGLDAWRHARDHLLGTNEKAVFTNELLVNLGLA